jgi:DNA repair photolyase
MSGNSHNINLNAVTKTYHSPRISSEFVDCSLPLTFDHYSRCGFGCQYCFSAQFASSNPAVKGNTALGAVNVKKLIDVMSGKYPDNPYYENFYKHRFILHWGGLTEPFCSIEAKVGTGYELLEYLAAVKYPTVFSSKGYCLFLGNKKYKKYEDLFAKSAADKNFMFAHSIIVDSDKTAKLIEPNTPSTTRRLESMKILADMGYWNILRLRPFIIGISDVGLESLLERSAAAGAKAISTEFFALDCRCAGLLAENMKEIDKLTGLNTYEYLKKLSPTERGGYLRGNRDMKEHYVKRMYKGCLDLGMQFNISDPDFKELNMSDSCCFRGSNKAWVRYKNGNRLSYKYDLTQFNQIYMLKSNTKKTLEVLLNGEWKQADVIEIPYKDEWIHITLQNGQTMTQTANHVNLVPEGEKKAANLGQSDWLLFNEQSLISNETRGDYDLGRFIGLFLGDGCWRGNQGGFFFGKNETEYVDFVTKFAESFGATVTSNDTKGYWIVYVNSPILKSIVEAYVIGDNCYNKRINESLVYNLSCNFRKGLIDGWIQANGKIKHEKYSSGRFKGKLKSSSGMSASKGMIKSLFNVAVSVGYFPRMAIDLNKKSNFTPNKTKKTFCYTLSLSNPTIHGGKSAYKIINGKVYVKIANIKKYKIGSKVFSNGFKQDIEILNDKAYCFKVPIEHKFTLGNGVITHNCGLPREYPDNPEMCNYTKGQLTGHLRRLRKRFWASKGEDRFLTFDMIEKDIANNWMSDPRYYGDSIKCWQMDYGIKTGHQMEMMNTWNNLRSAANPYNYFHGIVKPVGKDSRDMLIYEYVPHPYEYRWQSEGIKLDGE